MYPAFRRTDAEKWQKWKLYPGAVTVLLPRFFIFLILLIAVTIGYQTLKIGRDPEKPLNGMRKFLVHMNVKWLTIFVCFFSYWTHLTWDELSNESYEEYLGSKEEQKKCQLDDGNSVVPKRGPGKPSTLVCNHTGFFEALTLIVSPYHPSVVARVETKDNIGIASIADSI